MTCQCRGVTLTRRVNVTSRHGTPSAHICCATARNPEQIHKCVPSVCVLCSSFSALWRSSPPIVPWTHKKFRVLARSRAAQISTPRHCLRRAKLAPLCVESADNMLISSVSVALRRLQVKSRLSSIPCLPAKLHHLHTSSQPAAP